MVEVDGHLHVQVQEDKCQRAIFSMLRRLDLNVKHLVNDSAFYTNIGTLRKLQPAHVLTILFVHSTIKIYFFTNFVRSVAGTYTDKNCFWKTLYTAFHISNTKLCRVCCKLKNMMKTSAAAGFFSTESKVAKNIHQSWYQF